MHDWHQTFRQNALFIAQALYKQGGKGVAEAIRIGTVLICADVNKCYLQAQHEKRITD